MVRVILMARLLNIQLTVRNGWKRRQPKSGPLP